MLFAACRAGRDRRSRGSHIPRASDTPPLRALAEARETLIKPLCSGVQRQDRQAPWRWFAPRMCECHASGRLSVQDEILDAIIGRLFCWRTF
ncbi:hypothetical protein J2Z31_004067 [Sinorhizobium kostiense]|uniref:Transposase n=1 Tax=Sinorhizobium kostiense TaxID=76747 RepID=A0ABS4R3V1_9HYPH|nr:hypothetical protein [Sinorhizobium kostiense]